MLEARRRALRIDVACLVAGTIALRLPAYLAERHLTFDDAVYGASAVAMRVGDLPYREVFSSQGPLFLPLVYLADLVGFRTLDAPRLLGVASGITIVVATYLAGLAISDRGGALMAAGLTSVCASVLWVTGGLASDGPALAFAAVAVMLALRWRDDLTSRRAVAIGLAVGAALSIKALVLGVLAPVALVLLATRRPRTVLAAAGAAAGFHFALWLVWGPSRVWEQSYSYHLEVAGERTPGENLSKVLSTLGDRDLPVILAIVLAALAIVVGRRAVTVPRAVSRLTSPDVVLLAWLAAIVVVLAMEHPLWRPHVSQLIPVLALLAARHRPPWPIVVVAAILVAPYHLYRARDVLHPAPYRGLEQQVVHALAALPSSALAISDDPGYVWRAGRRTTPDLVDTSSLRIEAGNMTSASVARAAARPDVCAALIWSKKQWGSFADLPQRLVAAGYARTLHDDDRGRALYIKPACRPR
jgi:hypothetical protein